MQLNASPRTGGARGAQLRGTLPTVPWLSPPDPRQAGGLLAPLSPPPSPRCSQGSAPGTFASIPQPGGPCPALSCPAAHSR